MIEDRGSHNTIDIDDSVSVSNKFFIKISGSNNRIKIGKGTRLVSGVIEITNSNSSISIGDNCTLTGKLKCLSDDASISIGRKTTSMNAIITLHEPGAITLGDDCMLSGEVRMDVSDMHSILDAVTMKRINPPKDVIIGNHVWIGQGVHVLKGSVIGNHAIIGAKSLVNSHIPANSIAVGVPAKVIRKGVTWDRRRLPSDIPVITEKDVNPNSNLNSSKFPAKGEKMVKCILHVGAGKCGSSALQKSLSNSKSLKCGDKEAKYFSIHPDGSILHGDDLRENSARNVFGYVSLPNINVLGGMSEEAVSKARKRMKSFEGSTLIASSEGFINDHEKFKEGSILERLGLECDVVMYVRPPVDWLNSGWWQWGAWADVGFERWIKASIRLTHWGSIAKEWESVPGVKSVEIRILRGDIIEDFSGRYGISGLSTGFHNASLSPSILRFFQLHKDLRPGPHASQIDFALSKYIKADDRKTPWVIDSNVTNKIISETSSINEGMLAYMDDENRAVFHADERWRSAAPYADKEVESPNALDKKDIAEDLDRIAYEAIQHILALEKRSRSL